MFLNSYKPKKMLQSCFVFVFFNSGIVLLKDDKCSAEFSLGNATVV